uniref:Uncharacterized protein n=1 Tax=viral metagenome TaxID=1070528 RepID=A0A6C0JLC0_9ZZZZ
MKVAICCVAIGPSYYQEYSRLFRPSQEYYAKRHGYDFRVITEYQTDLTHPDAVCFQKYRLCSNEWADAYDYIVYLDADILINPLSPPIPFAGLGGKVGMVDEYSQPTPEGRIEVQRRNGWETSAPAYFKLMLGITFDTTKVFNGGVMVFQPKLHREMCEEIFNEFAHKNIGYHAGFHYEQATTNVELHKRDIIATLPNEFDRIWSLASATGQTLDDCFASNYFVHFAGHCDYDKVGALYARHLPSVAGFYQCYKQKAAFDHAIRSFRAAYPTSNLFVFNDGGDESLGDIARECSARYTYCERASTSVLGTCFDTPDGAMVWITRLREAVMNATEDYIMLLEDDVWVKRATHPSHLKYDLCGFNRDTALHALAPVQDIITRARPQLVGKELALAGFGGCMYRRSFFEKILADMNVIRVYIGHYYKAGGVKVSDCIVSFLTHIHGGTMGQYDGYCETWWPTYQERMNADTIEVLHKYKDLYVKNI